MQTFQNILIVGFGGFMGSVCRYLASGWIHRLFEKSLFPVGTAAVNIAGCFLIGLVGGLANQSQTFSPQLRLFLTMGLLGGFTTFSSFEYETLALLQDNEWLRAMINVFGQVLLGLVGVFLGYQCSKWMGA